jgi:small-conductance mechanosensitive channel
MFFTRQPKKLGIRSIAIAALLILFASAGIPATPADSQDTSHPTTTLVTSRPEEIISFLNQSVVWYRLLGGQQQMVDEPSDAIFFSDNRQIADQVVRLAFEYARAESQQLSASAGTGQNTQTAPNTSQYQNLVNIAEKTKKEISDEEKELEGLKQQLPSATGKKRALLEAAIAESEDELELLKARNQTIQDMFQFTSGVNAYTGAKGLQVQIEDLARTVPAAASDSRQPASGAPSTSAVLPSSTDEKAESSGLFGLIADVFEHRRQLRLLDASLRMTDSLADASKTLRAPLVSRMKELTQRSDEMANAPQSQDPAELAQQQTELKDITRQYKQLSAAILPLGKQNMLFDLYKRNVSNWQNGVQIRYGEALKILSLRLGTLLGVMVLILGASYIWRRATFRYVQDSRKRHQFLVLRRVIVLPLIAVIIVVAFANGLGSITTFAGLLTAGLAVALQNLILSIVGYFFLIGKYGVRVGDRVQIAGITGDVIDIGLVRLHMVETSSATGTKPSGRVVAISNNVVFQPNGIFKQIPGTSFVWHEVSLMVSTGSDYRQIEERMLQAVNRIFDNYRDSMETQRRSVERAVTGLSVDEMHPESRLHLTHSGTQIIIRYPVEMSSAAEIDDRIAREIVDATGRKPEVQAAEAVEAKPAVSEVASGG